MEKARFRQETILRHLKSAEIHLSSPFLHASSCSYGPPHEISNDDVVIVAACRTPICKAKRGAFKDTPAEDLLEHVLKHRSGPFIKEMTLVKECGSSVLKTQAIPVPALLIGYPNIVNDLLVKPNRQAVNYLQPAVLENTGVGPQEIGDVVVGNVLAMGNIRAAECRLAAFFAGFPESVPIKTVNRQCASGLQAVADVVAAIKSGFYEIGIAAGVESMSIDVGAHKPTFNPQVHICPNQDAKDCLIPMGITSEIVAEQYKVSRLDQDKAALLSHKKAAEAATAGKFVDEIVPVYTKVIDHRSGSERSVVVSADEGIRPDTSLSALSMLKPSFKDGGTTTAGNSSQVSDGAAAVMLMKREVALRRCLPILGTFRSFSAVGVKPAVMGVGPAFAIPAAVKAAKLKLDDIDLFEINEAFASQYVYCLRKLGLDGEKVNVNGGAIALGHPVGATGARCVATLLHEMKRRGRTCRYGVVSMCMGSGMGGAAVFESE